MADDSKPLVLITGAAGDVGSALADAFSDDHIVVGLDRPGLKASIPLIGIDLGSDDSVAQAFAEFKRRFGQRIASVIHLAAYFDFTGEDNPLYQSVNVDGTRRLLAALQRFEVGQFIYAGTMLVHAPCKPGERIDETQPLAPKWAYPQSKAAAEDVVRREHGNIPVVLLHLAGLYDETRCVPTLAHQVARIYERELQSYLYAGDIDVGQSMLHKEDMVDAFRRVVERRTELPPETVILIGEPEGVGYDALQDTIGRAIHGDADWTTLRVPKPAARLGAALQQQLEPLVPDEVDQGEKPFIRPFMVSLADDHYALDISRARDLLGWEPRHRIEREIPKIVATLKRDPLAWYRANRVPPPPWMTAAGEQGRSPEAVRHQHQTRLREQHASHLWAPAFNAALGLWLVVSPPMLDLGSRALAASDIVSGAALMLFGFLAMSWRFGWARWVCAAIGLWLLAAPLVFWAPTAAGYLNDTLVGTLAIGFAFALPPEPGVSPLAAVAGPDTPPGWSFNPSEWTQRLPIIVLAFVGLHISRYLAAYQLGHVDGVWEPFFAGGPDPKNGTEEIITSSVSEAWPVSDAGLGALTYALEILTGVMGSRRRWRTMPWLVLVFGLMIVPLGVVSIFFIVIQPIWIGTWCTLCLVAAAAMVVQIPYSIDEIVATGQFLLRRRRAGRSVLHVLLFGDTDDGDAPVAPVREFERPARELLREISGGGVNLPWSLGLAALLGAWLMGTRLTLGSEGTMAHAEHLIGSLVITVAAIACAEIARPLRYGLVLLGLALEVSAFAFDAEGVHLLATLAVGAALIVLALPRGRIEGRYGDWNRLLV